MRYMFDYLFFIERIVAAAFERRAAPYEWATFERNRLAQHDIDTEQPVTKYPPQINSVDYPPPLDLLNCVITLCRRFHGVQPVCRDC